MKMVWRVTTSLIPLFLGGILIVLIALGSAPRKDLPGLILFATAIMLGWIGIALSFEMGIAVDRLAPSKSLFESIDNRRVWREHKRLFPKSRLRTTTKVSLVLAVCCALVGLILFVAGARL